MDVRECVCFVGGGGEGGLMYRIKGGELFFWTQDGVAIIKCGPVERVSLDMLY